MKVINRLNLKQYEDFTTTVTTNDDIGGGHIKNNRLSGFSSTPLERFNEIIKHRLELLGMATTDDGKTNFDSLNTVATINLIVDKKNRLYSEIVLEPK